MPILHGLNKEQAVIAAKNCDYRLLEEIPALSYGNSDTENLWIQGDNLEALKALIPFYAGKVKCNRPFANALSHLKNCLEAALWTTGKSSRSMSSYRRR